MIAYVKNYSPFLLPMLLVFSRSLADVTIVFVSILFLYHSYKNIGWEWLKNKWFCFAFAFFIFCLTFNSAMSIDPSETFAYSLFFIRWPIFAMALAIWILNDLKSLKKFFFSMTIILIFIIFDTWWQFFFDYDIFGFQKTSSGRLTGPFEGKPHVGSWVAKLSLLPPLFFVLHYKLKIFKNYIPLCFFIFSTLLLLSVFITGERMALLLTFSCILFITFGLVFDKVITKKEFITFSSISFLFILIFLYFFPSVAERSFFSTITKIINWKSSDYGSIWQTAYEVWMQSPYFGVGLHKYRDACNAFAQVSPDFSKAIGNAACFHPHNISLQLLSETGIFGFLIFYIMVLSLAFSSLKIFFLKKAWFFFSLSFCIIFSCFLPIASNTSFFSNKYGAIVWLLIGVMLAVNNLYKTNHN